jgi:hypothetical protein
MSHSSRLLPRVFRGRVTVGQTASSSLRLCGRRSPARSSHIRWEPDSRLDRVPSVASAAIWMRTCCMASWRVSHPVGEHHRFVRHGFIQTVRAVGSQSRLSTRPPASPTTATTGNVALASGVTHGLLPWRHARHDLLTGLVSVCGGVCFFTSFRSRVWILSSPDLRSIRYALRHRPAFSDVCIHCGYETFRNDSSTALACCSV